MGDAGAASPDAVCPRCDRPNRLAAAYCGGCGLELPGERPCPMCGSPNPRRHRYCDMCGGAMLAGDTSRPPARPAPVRAGVGPPSGPGRAPRVEPPPGVPERSHAAGLPGAWAYVAVLAAAVAALPRLYGLDSLPAGLSALEEAFAAAASRVAQEGWIGLGPGAVAGEPAGFAYLLGAWSLVAGDSTLALRLLSAALGVAAVGLLYLLIRRLMGVRPALLASAIFAVSFWHIHLSRLVLPTMLTLTAGLAVANLLAAALDETRSDARRRILAIAAGLVLGSTPYVDNGFPILVAAVALFCAARLAGGDRRALQVVAVLWIAAAVAALPYLFIVASDPGAAFERVTAHSITASREYQDLQGIPEQTRHAAGSVASTAARVFFGAFGGEQTRLLDAVSGLLALVGLLACAARWRERGPALLLAFFGAGVVLAGLTTGEGLYGRLYAALPAALAAAGFGLHWTMTWMRGRFPGRAVYGFAIAAVVLIAYFNLDYYFGIR